MTNLERRAKYRVGLSTLYLPFYDKLCELLPPEWAPFRGACSFEEQDALFAQGRSKPGPKVTNAQGGDSPHCYGAATDWTIFVDGHPIWMPIKDPRWKVYQDACRAVGTRWGADWNDNGSTADEHFLDGPHNELKITCSWKQVHIPYRQNGMRAAQEFMEERLAKA